VIEFAQRNTVEQVEEGNELAPKFDANGLIPVVTTDYVTGELLMHAYMNAEALKKTIELGGGVLEPQPQCALAQGRDQRPGANRARNAD